MQGSFATKLQQILNNKPHTLQEIVDGFAEKSFAVLILLLMAIPALPLPTGGLTHIFELITLLLALELVIGRRSVWLPRRWQRLRLSVRFQNRTLPPLLKFIHRVGKYTRPRLAHVLQSTGVRQIIGLIIFVLTVFAFLAPPFSGLDTLPALGVVFVCLALLFEDIILCLAGFVIGAIGVGLVITLGQMVLKLL